MPLQASDVQPADDPARVLAQKRERAIRDAVANALLGLSGLYTGVAVLRLISQMDANGLAAIGSGDDNALIQAYQPVADLFDTAARLANDNLAGVTYDPLAASDVQTAIRQGFLDAIRASQSGVLRAVLTEALRTGLGPGATQRLLQQVIGLSLQEANAVLNFRRMLVAGDRAVLTRALRDKNYDAAIRQALAGGNRLSAEEVDQMVSRYAARMLVYRAETMAKTEAAQAAVGGIRNAYVQAVDTGQLYDSEVSRFWLVTPDEKTCPVCTSAAILNRGGVGVNEPYQTIAGPILAPLAHPRCRCSERYKANLTRLSGQPFSLAA